MLIPDPALRPPWRFAALAWVLMVPALVLSGFAVWTLRLDRRAAAAEERDRAGAVARTVMARITNRLHAPGRFAALDANAPYSGVRSVEGRTSWVMILDDAHRLHWPRRGIWPPVTTPLAGPSEVRDRKRWLEVQASLRDRNWKAAEELLGPWIEGSDGALESGVDTAWRANALLDLAHARREASEFGRAVTGYLAAISETRPGWTTPAGLAVRDVAALGLLDLAEAEPKAVEDAFRHGDPAVLTKLCRDLAALDSNPLSERAIAGLRGWVPRWNAASSVATRTEELLFPLVYREQVQRLYDALSHGRSWGDGMLFQVERQAWVAIRQSGDRDHVDARTGNGLLVYELHRWSDLMESVRETIRGIDPNGALGVSMRLAGSGWSMHQEEPSGVEGRAVERVTELLPWGLNVSVAVAPVSPAASVSGQRRREQLYGALVLGALVASAAAAWLTWRTLVRQHRLGIQKSNFVASVSHELRAPLASVRLLADNLEHDRVPDPARRLATLRLIGRECRRLGALVDNVLDLARIERRQKHLDPEPTDLSALVRETVAAAAVGGEDRRIRIRTEGVDVAEGADPVVATVDGRAMQQVLGNLLENALKHTPAGGEVRVGLAMDADGRSFTLTVGDDGPGIPTAERVRVFGAFHRLGSELRREQPGVGIGLAIVRHLVEAHGGRVWIEQEPRGGARVVVRIPIRLEPGPGPGPSRSERGT